MRTTHQIIDAALAGQPTTHAECLCALLVLDSLSFRAIEPVRPIGPILDHDASEACMRLRPKTPIRPRGELRHFHNELLGVPWEPPTYIGKSPYGEGHHESLHHR